ncbi:MAG: helix-turn-helix transcriptional regulator, partial [Microterricola sp.]
MRYAILDIPQPPSSCEVCRSRPVLSHRGSADKVLREARHRHGLTQAQLAARARTSQAAISRIERDLVSPSVATLASLLDLMNEELV